MWLRGNRGGPASTRNFENAQKNSQNTKGKEKNAQLRKLGTGHLLLKPPTLRVHNLSRGLERKVGRYPERKKSRLLSREKKNRRRKRTDFNERSQSGTPTKNVFKTKNQPEQVGASKRGGNMTGERDNWTTTLRTCSEWKRGRGLEILVAGGRSCEKVKAGIL